MNHKLLLQITAPAVLIGLLLFGACAISTWQINRLQTNMAQILANNVASLRAAEQMEINLRRLRFHCFLYLINPSPDFEKDIHGDHERFERWLADARRVSKNPEDQHILTDIETGYQRYRHEFDRLSVQAAKEGPFRDIHRLLEAHPLQYVVDPCRDLLQANEVQMEQTMHDAADVSSQVRLVMYLMGIGGPVSGIIIGYGVARGLSRSIYQLSVRVQNISQRLDQDVASVSVAADGDIQQIDSQLQHIVAKVEDVAERLQRQQRDMIRAEQLSAVGQLAASVAHEVRNPLSGIKLLVEAALRPRNPLPLSNEDLQVIHRELARVEQIVQGLLNFARLPAPSRTTCDIRPLIAQAIELVNARARQQLVEIVVVTPEEPVLGDVDPNLLGTVLVNLLLNAIDAMPQGGTLTIALTTAESGTIECTVSDSGTGIPSDMIERLFEPFSSTKATGTGLGLSICRRIIEEHGGQIAAENRPEGGARFLLRLPGAAVGPSKPVLATVMTKSIPSRSSV
jgi:signal transduction histidine kinase